MFAVSETLLCHPLVRNTLPGMMKCRACMHQRWKVHQHLDPFVKLFTTFLFHCKEILIVGKNILDTGGFTSHQWKRVKGRRPSFFTAYGLNRESQWSPH